MLVAKVSCVFIIREPDLFGEERVDLASKTNRVNACIMREYLL